MAPHSAVTLRVTFREGTMRPRSTLSRGLGREKRTPLEEDTEPSFVSIRHHVTLKCSNALYCLHCLFAFLLGIEKDKASLVDGVHYDTKHVLIR